MAHQGVSGRISPGRALRPSPLLAGSRVDPPHTWSGAPQVAPRSRQGADRRRWPSTPASRPWARGLETRADLRVASGSGQPRPPCRRSPGSTEVLMRGGAPRPGALAPRCFRARSALTTGVCRPDSPAPRRGRSATGLKGGNPEASSAPRSEEEATPAAEPRGELRPSPSPRAFHLQRRPAEPRAGAGAVCRLPGPSGSRCGPARCAGHAARRPRLPLPRPRAGSSEGPAQTPRCRGGRGSPGLRETPPDGLSREQSPGWRGLGGGAGRRRERAPLGPGAAEPRAGAFSRGPPARSQDSRQAGSPLASPTVGEKTAQRSSASL